MSSGALLISLCKHMYNCLFIGCLLVYQYRCNCTDKIAYVFFIYISYVLPQCILIKFDGKPYSNTEETFVMLLVELDGMSQSWTLTAALLDKSYGNPTHVFGTCFLFGRSHFLGIDLLRFFLGVVPILVGIEASGFVLISFSHAASIKFNLTFCLPFSLPLTRVLIFQGDVSELTEWTVSCLIWDFG